MLNDLFKQFDNIVVLDTETTGFSPRNDEIIELAMLSVSTSGRVQEYDKFVRLSPGRVLPERITELTHITQDMLLTGVSKQDAAAALARALTAGRTLIVAYNAQFDMGFLYYLLRSQGMENVLRGVKMLDAMTVYKDRRPYPHKLCNAVEAYSLSSQNTHRAIDDTRATFELLCAMEAEKNDLHRYINLFGYSPKFGVSGQRISSVTYAAQNSDGIALYEKI